MGVFACLFASPFASFSRSPRRKCSLRKSPTPSTNPLGDPGVIPVGADGKPLNLDFETGTLDDWTAEGKAFEGQPIKGDISRTVRPAIARRASTPASSGSAATRSSATSRQGTLTSAAFEVTHPLCQLPDRRRAAPRRRASSWSRADDNKVFYTPRGKNEENLRPVVVDLTKHQGQEDLHPHRRSSTPAAGGTSTSTTSASTPPGPKFKALSSELPVPEVAALYPHAGLSGEEAAKAMVVPPGFSVQCRRQEPDVKQPIAMAIDDRGRLWIAEAYTYPIRAAEGEGKDRILIFEDTDGDGTLRQAHGLHRGAEPRQRPGSRLRRRVGRRGAVSAVHSRSRTATTSPTASRRCCSTAGASRTRTKRSTRFIWGPDGWLYGCHGVFTHSQRRQAGHARRQAHADQRRHLALSSRCGTSSRSSPRARATRGASTSTTTARPSPRPASFRTCIHIIQGGRYQRQAGQHFNPYTYDDIKTIAEHRHYIGNQCRTAATAAVRRGRRRPRPCRGDDLPRRRLAREVPRPDLHEQHPRQPAQRGRAHAARARATSAATPPTSCSPATAGRRSSTCTYGPDGQVYMIDWYDSKPATTAKPTATTAATGGFTGSSTTTPSR